MMNKFVLDFELLAKEYICTNEFIILAKLSNDIPILQTEIDDDLYHLQTGGYIKCINENGFKVILREKGKLFINSVKYKEPEGYKEEVTTVKKSFNSFEEFVKEYRSLWDGLKPGAMGSKPDCTVKMRKWMINNPEYTQQTILKAARSYINSVENVQFLQQADYFIYKKDKYSETSRLSAFVDEEEVHEGGWSSNLK